MAPRRVGAEPPEAAAESGGRAAGGAVWPAYRRWRGLAGPLADFVLPAPFLAPWPVVPRLPAAPGVPALAAALVARAAGGAGTALFLEVPPRLGLATGLRLGRAGWTVIPLYGRWPAAGAVLPAERLTGWLLGVAGALDASRGAGPRRGDVPGGARPCLLLDSQRARPVAPGTLRRRLDNRYDYPAYLLPPPAWLVAAGAKRVLWAAPAAAAPPDLQDYADALVHAGIALDLVRLGDLAAGRASGATARPGARPGTPPGAPPGVPPGAKR